MSEQPHFHGDYADGYYRWEYTDTFGGEANYCWVRRGLIHAPSVPDEAFSHADRKAYEQRICNAARKAAGLAGVRSKRSDMGDVVRYAQGCTVLFVELGECWIPGSAAEIAEAKAEAVKC